jgi:hypothetical protein
VNDQNENTNPEQWQSPFSRYVTPSTPSPESDEPSRVIGTPDADTAFWPGQQSYADTCAIRCQEFILERFTGGDYDETTLVNEAMIQSWYVPGNGTPLEYVGNLLDSHGIAISRYANATVPDLAAELAQGHKLIVGLDSGELWQQNPLLERIHDIFGIQQADHAVVVAGIDTTMDPPAVIIHDPGTGDFAARYPLDLFSDAWRDSNFFMIATQQPAPATLPEMAGFDYQQGHISEVWGLPFAEFEQISDSPETWIPALEQSLSTTLGSDAEADNWRADWHDEWADWNQEMADYHASTDDYDNAAWYEEAAEQEAANADFYETDNQEYSL